ncbi:MAG: hypothetical protein WCE87_07130 [Candidatus Udaeobacter sp.]
MTNFRSKAEYCEHQFFAAHRELLAHFDMSQVQESLIAYLQLNETAETLRAAATKPNEYRALLSAALVTLIDRNALTQLADLNEDALGELAELRRKTGIGVEQLIPPPPPAPTAAELLREEILNDWRTLPMSKVREKKNGNRQYAAMLDQLANDGSLESSATSLTRAGA